MVHFILTFAAAFGISWREAHQEAKLPQDGGRDQPKARDSRNSVLLKARRALDGVDYPFIL